MSLGFNLKQSFRNLISAAKKSRASKKRHWQAEVMEQRIVLSETSMLTETMVVNTTNTSVSSTTTTDSTTVIQSQTTEATTTTDPPTPGSTSPTTTQPVTMTYSQGFDPFNNQVVMITVANLPSAFIGRIDFGGVIQGQTQSVTTNGTYTLTLLSPTYGSAYAILSD